MRSSIRARSRMSESSLQVLLQIATFNICYIQGIFPEKYFLDETVPLLGIKIKRLMPMNAESRMLIDWLEKGVFDALQHKYLKAWVFDVVEENVGPNEEYEFSFDYLKHGEVSMTMRVNRNKMSATFEASSGDGTPHQLRSSAFKMIRALIQMMIHLDQMPGERTIMMKLVYNENITPENYEPQFFKECFGTGKNVNNRDKILILKISSTDDFCDEAHNTDSSSTTEDQLSNVHGTTILALTHQTGIFMACDGRAYKNGDIYTENENKMERLGRFPSVLSNSCGSALWYQAIRNHLHILLQSGEISTVQQCAEYTRNFLNDSEYLVGVYDDDDLAKIDRMAPEYEAGIIFGACEADGDGNNVPRIIYADRNECHSDTLISSGSGASYAHKAIERSLFLDMNWADKVIHIEEAMFEASKLDDTTGGMIRIEHIGMDNQISRVSKKHTNQLEEEKNEREKSRKKRERKRKRKRKRKRQQSG